MSEEVAVENGEDFTADLDAGFSGDETIAATTTPDAEEVVQEEVQQEETPVEYVQLSRQEVDELKAYGQQMNDLRAENKRLFDTAFGKIGGLQQGVQQMLERKQAETPQGQAIEITDEDIAELKDFPELANGVRSAINKAAAKMRGTGQNFDPSIIDQRLNPALDTFQEAQNKQIEVRLLTRQHRDWRNVTASPEWQEWLGKKPEEFVRQLSDTWDADFIGDAIDEFKSAQKPKANTKRQSVLEAAVAPKSSGNASRTRSEIDDFEAGFSGN